VPGLFDEGAVDVPQKLRMRFPDWVAKVRGRQIADDYDLRDRAGAAVDRALAALCRAGRGGAGSRESASAQEDGSSPDDDANGDADAPADQAPAGSDAKTSLEILEKAVEDHPDHLPHMLVLRDFCLQLGETAESEGRSDEARMLYERALEMNKRIVAQTPDDLEAALLLSLSTIS
jgi:tetratricopeptide (TPR) repeat protein